ncbi:aminotransferase class I/II-fold pyridoxal phosphate-dependent enzyme [Silvanigrella paludirubra]|uniref:Aminotransferase class I/II-fold pyridoxal phosphate-dependent enzyme n=1 Tax=Silvanigrella paludirubra TaxID=2499159 RepID=A0A6N6VR21_9BACT|nr:PLP-dependent aspartate aminotransferase family protein [Silvanigrella paludirubra]KAB8037127.1 aminotransferase class I/II-fold pyridoxal phosphate-dependent enzyme [Silvanigrella paludirubra]
MSKLSNNFDTICVHAGVEPESVTGAIMTPIFQTSTYVQDSPGNPKIYDYSRSGNPTRTALENSLAALEKTKHAVSFSSGLAAVSAIAQLLNPGDHVLVCDDVYGGTGRLFRKIFAKYNIDFEFIDMTITNNLESYFKKNTKLVWIETPTNPLLKLIDIEYISKLSKKFNAISVVDNTFSSPIFQTPIELGADIVLHSTTKYIGGHSDLVGGCLMLNDNSLAEQLKFIQFAGGSVNAPIEAFLLLRSIKTLSLRMKKHNENALFIAKEIQKLKIFSEVIFPGLEDHPQYSLAKKQMRGFSGMISARINGDYDKLKTFVSRLKYFSLAESLGGVESLINHPETMTHASVPLEHRKKLGITSDLLRFSVGIEDAQDLLEDIKSAANF